MKSFIIDIILIKKYFNFIKNILFITFYFYNAKQSLNHRKEKINYIKQEKIKDFLKLDYYFFYNIERY